MIRVPIAHINAYQVHGLVILNTHQGQVGIQVAHLVAAQSEKEAQATFREICQEAGASRSRVKVAQVMRRPDLEAMAAQCVDMALALAFRA